MQAQVANAQLGAVRALGAGAVGRQVPRLAAIEAQLARATALLKMGSVPRTMAIITRAVPPVQVSALGAWRGLKRGEICGKGLLYPVSGSNERIHAVEGLHQKAVSQLWQQPCAEVELHHPVVGGVGLHARDS